VKTDIIRTSVYLERDTLEATKDLPRKASTSAILRLILVCLTTSDKGFEKWLQGDPARVEVAKYIGKAIKGKWHLFL